MDSRAARNYIVAATLFAAVLLFGSSLAALEPVKVATQGNAFSVVDFRGNPVGNPRNTADVQGGRQFRGGARETLKIKGVLRMPPARPGASKTQKLQGLVVYFRCSRNGPTLQSVSICNGANCTNPFDTHLEGDYTTKAIPKVNMWAFNPPMPLNSQLSVVLEVRFPGGFDSSVDPGEFLLTSVEADFAPEPLVLSTPSTTMNTGTVKVLGRSPAVTPSAPPPVTPAPAPPVAPGAPSVVPAASIVGVIYARANNNDLLWYRHDGRDDGTFKWAADTGRKVGGGWAFRQLFPGGGGVIYAIKDNGDLLWYRNDGISDGTFKWAAGGAVNVVNTGWNFKQVFSGGGGVIYAITENGDLMWFRHIGYLDGSNQWDSPEGKKIGEGWNYQHVFAGGGGVIYAIADNGDLLWFRHDGRATGSDQWTAREGKKVGSGWTVKQVFSSGNGVIYAVMPDGELRWNRHDGFGDGSFSWADNHGKKVGSGWDVLEIFSGATLRR